MEFSQVNQQIILDINKGKESAFSILYDSYFTYLCVYATTYLFDPDEAKEVVNDVFVHIWYRRGGLTYPIHSYLLCSVKNGCLNYIRSLRTRERIIDEYREELLRMQEEFCIEDYSPLQELEVNELKQQVENIVKSLPEKCRIIFEKYLYSGISPQEVADELGISVNTVRVQIKNAMDKMKMQLGSAIVILLLFLLKK